MKTKEEIILWCKSLLSMHPNVEDQNYLNSIIEICKENKPTKMSTNMWIGRIVNYHLLYFCPKCGERGSDEWKFCPYCGSVNRGEMK